MVISYPALAEQVHKSAQEVEEIIHRCRAKLLAHRLKYRPRPHLDNKVHSCVSALIVDCDFLEWPRYSSLSPRLRRFEIDQSRTVVCIPRSSAKRSHLHQRESLR